MQELSLASLYDKFIEHHTLLRCAIEVTSACNENCIHCLQEKEKTNELTETELCNLIDQIIALQCPIITFTGGEPFVRPDFINILTYANQHEISLEVLTNGTLISASKLSSLKNPEKITVRVSLYAARPEIHDAITRLKGSFQKTISAILLLTDFGIHVKVMAVLLAQNIHQYPELQELCNQLGVNDFRVNPLLYPRLNDPSWDKAKIEATEEQILSLLEHNPQIIEGGNFSFENAYQPEGTPLCHAGNTLCVVNPQGEVYPCISWRVAVGNIREEALSIIWKDSPLLTRIRGFRKKYPAECLNCDIRDKCSICPGLSWLEQGDAFARSSTVCRMRKIFAHVERR